MSTLLLPDAPEPIVLPSLALGLLVTFRTNTANARYMEARNLWGEIVNTSRDITRVALQWLPDAPCYAGAPSRASADVMRGAARAKAAHERGCV